MTRTGNSQSAFTLVELSIVLVIIGLIIGGVLVGRDLITTAQVRAQISQIEKYQAAVNTFKGKYGYLPGDIPDPYATQYGFIARGSNPGQGDGNGLIEGYGSHANLGWAVFGGETQTFFVDLSTAKLINGGFAQPYITGAPATVTNSQVQLFMPSGKIGRASYVYVWSGGPVLFNFFVSNQLNYFGLSAVLGTTGGDWGVPNSNVPFAVQEAYSIDNKMDDGLPQSGRVIAGYPTPGGGFWAAGGPSDPVFGESNSGDASSINGGPVTSVGDIGDGMAAGSNSCYDGSTGLPEKYSMQINNGAGVNCALSFQFQ